MVGKYRNPLRFNAVRAERALLRGVIRPLISWKPLSDPVDGYSVLIGSNASLVGMLGANLRMLEQQRLENLERVIVVFDQRREKMPGETEEAMSRRFGGLPLEFVYYNRMEAAVLGLIGWGWTYAWLSWCKGIAACRTGYAMLHDFDAMLLRRDVIERRYEAIRERGDQYCGVRYYEGNGVEASDGLVTTFELMFDAAFVRKTFRPIDLFNHVCVYNGRTVDFDTFLYAQSRAGRGSVMEIAEEEMVHPSQMICQYTDYLNRRRYVPPERNNLLMIPYFLYIGGAEEMLREQSARLKEARNGRVHFFDREMDLSKLSASHADWIRKQGFRLEEALVGQVRDEVREYFEAIEALRR